MESMFIPDQKEIREDLNQNISDMSKTIIDRGIYKNHSLDWKHIYI